MSAAEDPVTTRAWRRAQRERLIAERMAMTEAARARASAAINEAFWDRFGTSCGGRLVAGYWPMRGEVDCMPLLRRLLDAGAEVALPITITPRVPLEFRPWRPETPMASGRWEIPHPAEGPAVRPDLLLIPLVGFDAEGHRLGNGGGYYDRTLAALADDAPLAVGLGFELGRLPSIRPAAHDMRMDVVITEAGVFETGR